MKRINIRSVQIISLSVLILFSGVYSLFFGLFYNTGSEDTTNKTEEKLKENNKSSSLAEYVISEQDNVSSFDSDAIIILPGITGSELLSNADYPLNDDVTVKKGDYVWLPTEISKLAESFGSIDTSELQDLIGNIDIPVIFQDYIYYALMSLEMLAMDENGEAVYDLVPKPTSNDDLYMGTLGTATSMYNRLKDEFSSECDVIFYSYDWRYSCVDIAKTLEDYINEAGYERVTFVCHSMGGIVAAHYLDRNEENISKTAQVITIGTPYGGSAKALMALQNGRFIEIGMMDPLIKRLSFNMQSIYELLPTEDMISSLGGYISDNGTVLNSEDTSAWYVNEFKQDKNGSDVGVNAAVYKKAVEVQNMLINDGVHIMNDPRIDVCMIAGYDFETVQRIFETDDYISQTAVSYEGDGTVSIDSAAKFEGEYFDNPIYFVNAEHRMMLHNDDIIELTVNAIRNGSEIDIEAINEDILTPDNLTVKNNGEFDIKNIEDSVIADSLKGIYEKILSKEQNNA